MSDNEQWGVGSKADAKAFDRVKVGQQEVDLIFGEFPHSRRDNNEYIRTDSGNITGFDGFRRLIDVEIKSKNYMKESDFSGDEVRKEVMGYIIADGVRVYEVFGREVNRVLQRVAHLIDELGGHSSGWLDKKSRDALVGRKIFYYDQPATITRLIEDQGAIMITTDPSFKPPTRGNDEDEIDSWDDWREGDYYEVKDDVLSPHIWWWRD